MSINNTEIKSTKFKVDLNQRVVHIELHQVPAVQKPKHKKKILSSCRV